MILEMLLGTIAATAAGAPPVRTAPVIVPPVAVMRQPGVRLVCRVEFGTASLVQRGRVCHTAAEWRALDARRIARRRQGL